MELTQVMNEKQKKLLLTYIERAHALGSADTSQPKKADQNYQQLRVIMDKALLLFGGDELKNEKRPPRPPRQPRISSV